MHPTACLQMTLLWTGALGTEVELFVSFQTSTLVWTGALGTEVELFVSFQRDVWCRAEKEVEKWLSSTRVILALSVTRETLAVGGALSCINWAIKLLRGLLLEDGMLDRWFGLGLFAFCGQSGFMGGDVVVSRPKKVCSFQSNRRPASIVLPRLYRTWANYIISIIYPNWFGLVYLGAKTDTRYR
jgi:hypothetical protein